MGWGESVLDVPHTKLEQLMQWFVQDLRGSGTM